MATPIAALQARINAAHRYRRELPGRDTWQTPAEFDAAGVGDCEDFALAYWYALRGWSGHPRLACCLRADRQAHMVCLYYPPGATDPQVLDVAADAVSLLSERPDLVVLFELDAHGLHSSGGTFPLAQAAPWARVLGRMRDQEEGR